MDSRREPTILSFVDGLPDPFGDNRRIFVQSEKHGPFEARGPVMTTRTPPGNGSAAIHPSYCSLTCLPPASTAVSIRSRGCQGSPCSRRRSEACGVWCLVRGASSGHDICLNLQDPTFRWGGRKGLLFRMRVSRLGSSAEFAC